MATGRGIVAGEKIKVILQASFICYLLCTYTSHYLQEWLRAFRRITTVQLKCTTELFIAMHGPTQPYVALDTHA